MRDSFVSNELLATIREQFQLNWNGTHGIAHFMRVRENGLALCAKNGARPHIVELFAFLHDSRRLNENADPDHGKRAAEFAFSLRKSLLTIGVLVCTEIGALPLALGGNGGEPIPDTQYQNRHHDCALRRQNPPE